MSAKIIYPFDNPANYVFDSDKIVVSGVQANLKLVDNPGQNFIEDFSDDTGFTYDPAKAEFVGGLVRQKDQRPAGATFGATYTNNINGNWGGGVLTGSAFGGAPVSGGKLDLKGGTVKYVDYQGVGNSDSPQTGCIRFKYTPNYSGIPATDQNMFCISLGLDNDSNSLAIRHNSITGNIFLRTCDSVGNYIDANVQVGAWSPVSGTEYEIEYNYNFTIGAGRIFINGVQIGSTTTSTGTRTSSIGNIRIGNFNTSNFTANFEINDLEIFSTVQHTANYPSGYVLSETIFAENNIICPEMEYTGAGALISFDDLITIENSTPKYTLQIERSGNYLYWDGSAWTVSDGTYVQATNKTDFNLNKSSLPVNGKVYGQFKIIFGASNNQSSISELTASLTAQIYSIDDPVIELAQSFRIEELLLFLETGVKTGLDDIKYNLKKESLWHYWDGSAWVVSDGTYTETNDVADIISNISAFTNSAIAFNVKIFLHSDDGTTTPSISQLEITYDFSGEEEDSLNIVSVYWYSRNADGSVNTSPVYAELSSDNVRYKENVLVAQTKLSVTPDSITGYAELLLLDNYNMEDSAYYSIIQNSKVLAKIYVPVVSGALLWNIEI